MKQNRRIITINEEKCDGCGLCVSACAEGALQIIDGKAKLISETYCDGLGACLGECPRDAIVITEREAEAFDETAVAANLALKNRKEELPCGCPGTAVRDLRPMGIKGAPSPPAPSQLANWPIQLMLIPTGAPYLRHADLVISADCVPCAVGDFQRRFVQGRVLIIACPKLDDSAHYVEKLAEMFTKNPIRSLTVPFMEVPCCSGLVRIIQTAQQKAGTKIPTTFVKVGINGQIQDEMTL